MFVGAYTSPLYLLPVAPSPVSTPLLHLKTTINKKNMITYTALLEYSINSSNVFFAYISAASLGVMQHTSQSCTQDQCGQCHANQTTYSLQY